MKATPRKLMPGWAADDIARHLRGPKAASDRANDDAIKKYQAMRRKRIQLGRDIFGGKSLKPRHIDAEVNWFPLRFKKPTTIIPEGTAMMDAANDGVISEPDTPEGIRDWEKYKKEVEHGKRRYKKYVRPDD